MIGTNFAGFYIEKELGRGTFGVVYEIVDAKKVHWALKIFDPLPNLLVARDELRRRFAREIRYQSVINHPNVVRIAHFDLDHDPPYFVMELARASLLDLLRNKIITPQNAVSAITDMLTGLEAMHDAGYKHRDLKPGNVLAYTTTEANKDFRFAISDFGLIAPPENDTSTLTATGVGGGTIDYAAPEAMKDLKRVTVRSDIYSVGAILHDIYVGQRRIPCTKLTGPGLIGQVIEKCTETNQSRRFANVAELRNAYVNAALAAQFEKSDQDADIVALLEKESLTAEEWDAVDIRIQERETEDGSNYEIFRALKLNHINSLAHDHPDVFNSIARSFNEHIFDMRRGFPFEYCDVLATKLRAIFDNGDVELKALSLSSLLVLGTSHNRWYVERLFGSLADATLEEAVAKRFVTECAVRDIDLETEIHRWEISIASNRAALHPVIQDACK